MNTNKSSNKKLVLILSSILVILAGSFGAFMSVDYFLKADSDETLIALGPTTSPTVSALTSTPYVTATPTIGFPTATPTIVTFQIEPSATPTVFDYTTPVASESVQPSVLPITSSVPRWVGIVAAGITLMITAAMIF